MNILMYNKLRILLPAIIFTIFGLTQYFGSMPGVNNFINDNILVSARPAAENIIIVGIDERSINEIGTWPWPRFFVAEAVNQLIEMEAAVIGINVLYDTLGTVPEYDEEFVSIAMETDTLVLGGMGVVSMFQTPEELIEIEYYILPFDELAEAVTIGFMNALPDESDGVKRRSLTSMRFGDITVHSFPYEVYRTYRRTMSRVSPEDIPLDTMGQFPVEDIPLDTMGQFPIRFVGGPKSFTSVSLWGVINEEYHPAIFRDAIVLIGPYAQGIGEGNFATPMNRGIATYGVEIYANVIQNLLEGVIIIDGPWWLDLVILIFTGLIMAFFFKRLKPLAFFIVTLGITIIVLVGVRVTYDHMHMIVQVGDTIVCLWVTYVVYLSIAILSAQDEKRQIKDMFSRFVAPEVVNEIISGTVEIQLGGVVKEITALFVDIRGFTAFSETNPPEKVVEIINRYLALTSSAIQQNSGTIDKYMGDATMALFNAPNDVPDHALKAVKAAWAMKQGSDNLREEILREYGIDLQFGIGVNTGSAVVGNMGSDFRMDYTAIGDTINTTARLEENAEKGQIIISDATYQKVKDHVEVDELGTINVKNKKIGIVIYSVVNVDDTD